MRKAFAVDRIRLIYPFGPLTGFRLLNKTLCHYTRPDKEREERLDGDGWYDGEHVRNGKITRVYGRNAKFMHI